LLSRNKTEGRKFATGSQYARRQGVLDSPNPTREVQIPRARPASETHAYTLEEEVRGELKRRQEKEWNGSS